MLSSPIVLAGPAADMPAWQTQLRQLLPNTPTHAWPEACADARIAIVWGPEQAFFDAHPHLEWIFNMGAGVDALLALRLPAQAQAQIVRIEDGGMGAQMAEYVCHAVIRHFREFDHYAREQHAANWQPRRARMRHEFPIGIMGVGVLGQRVARALQQFDFRVHGWSRQPKTLPDLPCYSGPEGLAEFMAATRILVCLLPLTPDTRGLLNYALLSQLQPQAYVINVARGKLVVEADLLRLLDEQHLAGAALDVMWEEPLPATSPLWTHPRVSLTPHIAAQTLFDEGIRQITHKLQAALTGEAISGIIDTRRGY